MEAAKLLLVGLGNPGDKYVLTRHNLGFLVIYALADLWNLKLKEDRRFSAHIARMDIKGHEVHLLAPLTYMNESGWAVSRYMGYFKLNPSQLVVISDDVALPFGTLRFRTQGSSGGHNGLKSVAALLGTESYARLRMGIGSPKYGESLADYVLSDFTAEERKMLPDFVKAGIDVLQSLMRKEKKINEDLMLGEHHE